MGLMACAGCRAGNAHGLIDIAASGKRITDGSADARCRTAKRFNLGGVVMSFVLKEKKPVFIMVVDVDFYFNGAGIYLFGLISSRKHRKEKGCPSCHNQQ